MAINGKIVGTTTIAVAGITVGSSDIIQAIVGEVATISVVGTTNIVNCVVTAMSVGANEIEDIKIINVGRKGLSALVNSVEASKENIKDAPISPPTVMSELVRCNEGFWNMIMRIKIHKNLVEE